MKKTLFCFILLSGLALAVEPDIVVNNSTGSDTGASGAPSSFGPFSAVATCHTNGAGSTTIQWAANPLTGVPTDGSALLWLATSSGRRWSKISGRAAGTVTVADSFNIAAGSPVDCAVGGKRASISATRTMQDLKPSWWLSIENTGTDYSHSAVITSAAQAGGSTNTLIRGTGGRPNLVWTSNTIGIQTLTFFYLENLAFVNTSAAKGSAQALSLDGSGGASQHNVIRDCLFDGWNFALTNTGSPLTVYNTEIKNGAASGLGASLNMAAYVIGNYAHTNAGPGLGGNGLCGRCLYLYNLSTGNTTAGGHGLDFESGGPASFHNTAYGNEGSGFISATTLSRVYVGNLSTNNTRYGIEESGATGTVPVSHRLVDSNAYFSNTIADYETTAVAQGPNDTTGVSPGYVNAAGGDWSLGAGLINKGFPLFTLVAGISSTTVTGTEPGASQRLGAGGNFAY
jgi:hypothetical protein